DTAPWSQIITSPLQRCQAFAERLAARHDIPCSVEHDFREVGFGDWEGRTPAAIQAENPQQYADFYRDPVTLRPPGAEDLTAFIERVQAAYEHQLERYRSGHILIVAHAGVNRAIIAQALHCAPLGLYRIQVKPAGMSRLSHHEHGSQLLYHNCKLADMA
ncbi:MAG: histidine phosphatase family protein, partial [Gammaproteobacteria bacterium]